MDTPTTHYRALDSLRGIAALMVVLLHFDILPWDALPALEHDWSWLLAARMAVVVFFVLSGFVLALPYFSARPPVYRAYVTRRFFRIYPPYAFALLVAALLCTWLADRMPGHYLLTMWFPPVTWKELVSGLLMTGAGTESIRLDQPVWTMIMEMRISLLFPLLVWWVARFGWAGIVCAWAIGFGCYGINSMHGGDVHIGATFGWSLLLTFYYVPYFMLGILIAARREAAGRWLARIPTAAHLLIWLLVLIAHVWLYYTDLTEWGAADLIYGLFAAYLIAICVREGRLARLLETRVLLWLGGISYSLYLIHWPVLVAMYYLLYGHISQAIYTAITLPVVLVAGFAMRRLVELPSLNLGRRLAGRAAA